MALVLFTDPFQYPPTLAAARILTQAGYDVDLIGLRIPHVPRLAPPDGVRLVDLGIVHRGVALRFQYAAFTARCLAEARRRRYVGVIGYDMMAALPGYLMAGVSGARFVYHNHDLMLRSQLAGVFYPLIKRAEEYAARYADQVVFPQPERARLFRAEARLREPPTIVFNCPAADWAPRSGSAPPDDFALWRARVGRVVLYQGGLAEHRGLLALVDSVPKWSFEGGLCLVGLPLEPGVVETIRARASANGVADRVLVLPACAHEVLAAITHRADVGVGVLAVGHLAGDDPTYVNLRHLAGASNKIFEYMAAALPVLSARGGGFDRLIDEPRHGVLCEGGQVVSIAAALNRLFETPGLRDAIAAANRRAFEEQYNYERQFEPVLRLLGT